MGRMDISGSHKYKYRSRYKHKYQLGDCITKQLDMTDGHYWAKHMVAIFW